MGKAEKWRIRKKLAEKERPTGYSVEEKQRTEGDLRFFWRDFCGGTTCFGHTVWRHHVFF